MAPLTIYFNEISLHTDLTSHHCNTGILQLCELIDSFFQLRTNGKVAFHEGPWNTVYGQVILKIHFKHAYEQSKDKYRRFLSRVTIFTNEALPKAHEINWRNSSTCGITLAECTNSWVFSVGISHQDWSQTTIEGQRLELDSSGNLSTPLLCYVRNLANDEHLHHWETDIRDWGATVAPSCVLDTLKGHNVVMYPGPKEHNPPHVHVLFPSTNTTLAKYRIEDCALEDGKPTLNAAMKDWITRYRDQLLRSWDRCQRGGHPYVIEKTP